MAGLSGKNNLEEFDYESKVWGAGDVQVSPFYIQGLKLKYTLEALKDIKGKVLDIGCGGGNMAKAIKKYRPDLEVYGTDISKRAIEIAKKNPQKVQFSVSRSEELPFKDDYFDAVVMYDVLEHIKTPDDSLREMKRVLKKNGVMHIFSPLDGQPWTLYGLIRKMNWQPKNNHTGHLHVFSDRSFKNLLNRNHFRVMDTKYSFHLIFSFFDIVYFSLLEIFKYNPPSSIEGMIQARSKTLFAKLFNILYRTVIVLGYYESLFFFKVPGGGGHLTINPL